MRNSPFYLRHRRPGIGRLGVNVRLVRGAQSAGDENPVVVDDDEAELLDRPRERSKQRRALTAVSRSFREGQAAAVVRPAGHHQSPRRGAPEGVELPLWYTETSLKTICIRPRESIFSIA